VRRSILALVALAALLAGWATAPFDGGGTGGAPEASPGERDALDAPLDAPAEPGAHTPAIPEEPEPDPEPGSAGTDPTPSPRDDLAALLARFPAREYAGGDGSITGTVLRDEDDAPLAGIAIDAIIHGTTPGVEQKGLDHPDLLGFILEEIDQYHYDIAMARRAVTDAEGRFRIDGLRADAEYHLNAAPSDEWFIFAAGRSRNLSPGASVEFRVAPIAFVTVEVLDASGAPVEMGSVGLGPCEEGASNRFRANFSAASREIRVPIPYTRLVATLPNGESTESVDLSLVPGERRTVSLSVRPAPGLDVTVLAADPIDRVGAGLALHPLDGPPIPADPRRVADDVRARSGSVNVESGRWRSDLEPGEYRLRLHRDGELLHEEDLRIGNRRRTLEIPIPPRPSSRLAYVRVLGPDGLPAQVDDISLYRRVGGERTWRDCEVRSVGAGGLAILARGEPSPDSAGGSSPPEDSLVIDSSQNGIQMFPVSFGVAGFQEMRYAEPVEVSIDLLGYVGHELQGRVGIVLGSVETELDSEAWGWIDAVGRAKFSRVSPGRKRLRVFLQDSWSEGPSAIDREIDISPGKNAFAIPLPPLHALRVRCPPESAGRAI